MSVHDHAAVMTVTMNSETVKTLKGLVVQLEARLNSDVVSLVGEIRPGFENVTRMMLEPLADKKNKLPSCCTPTEASSRSRNASST